MSSRPSAMLARRAFHHVMDWAYPPRCVACASMMPSDATLCPECDERAARDVRRPACDYCGMPVFMAGAPCSWCQGKGLRPFNRIGRLGVLDGSLKQMIHRGKYRGQWPLLERLARDLLDYSENANAILQETDVLVPVPLYRGRQMLRGYNQADVIARRLGQMNGLPVAGVARRKRRTETQTHMSSKASRAINLRDAFRLRRGGARRIAGLRVTLIDDVLTTGATLQSLARALQPAEPAALSAIVLAVADPSHRHFERV